jgi:hypothetical protein
MTSKLEEIGSKAAGVAKGAVAAVSGLTGVFRRLAQEHGEVTALMLRVKASSSPDVRCELIPTIRKELLAHEQAELHEVYRVFLQHDDTRAFAEAHERDASQLQTVLDELMGIAVDDSAWDRTFDHLFELVQAHVKCEEHEYFPVGQRAFAPRTDEMLARYDVIRAQALRDLNRTP